jgi:hypothetical protein
MSSEPKIVHTEQNLSRFERTRIAERDFSHTWEAKCNWEGVGAVEESELRSGRESCGGQEKKGRGSGVFSLPGSAARTSRQLLSVLREEGQGPGTNISACG